MLNYMTRIAASAAIALASASPVLSKAHDQGVAEGGEPGAQTGARVGRGGVAGAVNNGARGRGASDAETGRSNNATNPTVGNGANVGTDE